MMGREEIQTRTNGEDSTENVLQFALESKFCIAVLLFSPQKSTTLQIQASLRNPVSSMFIFKLRNSACILFYFHSHDNNMNLHPTLIIIKNIIIACLS